MIRKGIIYAVVALSFAMLVESQPYSYLPGARRMARFTAAPEACAAGAGSSGVYYNSTDNTFYGCDGTSWKPFAGAGAACLGCNNTWTGTNEFNGNTITAMAAGGVSIGDAVPGSDFSGFLFEGNSANANQGAFYYVDSAFGEFVLNTGDSDSSFTILFDQSTASKAGATTTYGQKVVSSLTATPADGSDTYNALSIGLTVGNPTGVSNTHNVVNIAALTGDANTNLNAINIDALTGTVGAAGEQENAIDIKAGWDMAIRSTTFGTSSIPAFGFFDGTLSAGMYLTSIATGGKLGLSGPAAAGMFQMGSFTAGTSGSFFLIANNTLPIMNGTDTERVFWLAPVNSNHTGVTNTLTLLDIGDGTLVGDANANLNGIHIEAITGTAGAAGEEEIALKVGNGWDYLLDAGGGILFANLGTPALGHAVYCSDCKATSTTDDTCAGVGNGTFAFRIRGGAGANYWSCIGNPLQ